MLSYTLPTRSRFHCIVGLLITICLCSVSYAASQQAKPPWEGQYKIKPYEKDRRTPADIVGPDGLVYPNWTKCGVQGGIPAVKTFTTIEKFGGKANDNLDDSAALDRACKAAFKLSKAYRLFLAEAERLSGTIHWLRGRPGAARESWEHSLDVARELEVHYELGLTHLEMGWRLKDQSHLERAEAILSESGASWHLAQLRKQHV